MSELIGYLKPYKKEVILGPIFKLIEAIFELLLPTILALIINNGVNQHNTAYVIKMGFVMLAMSLLGFCSSLVCQYFAARTSQGFGTTLRNAMFTHIFSLSHVDFSYNPHHPLIQDFSLTVKPGSRIAIVGHTGAGKTTLINLLMRYYEIDSGTIAIDGTNIQSISRDSLRRSFGMVPQDTWLFTGTVRENLAYGKPDATENEIIAAAKAVNAHSFIRRLPQGYDTVIDDSSDQFSQGQKQLLTIARVMLVNPPMLILDEATSSVDTRTELIIQKAFTELSAGKTSFIIAHRLSTIRDADLILVLDKGNIVESGTHQKLLEKNGVYAHLYNSQFSPNH